MAGTEEKYVYVVRENSDKTEGRGTMIDVGVFDTEDEAFECNRSVSGVMGHPRHFGGMIYKVRLGEYPLDEELIFGFRTGSREGISNWGWLDFRDVNEEDPEWVEYIRLRKKFDLTFEG
jgi:hypothetical protein